VVPGTRAAGKAGALMTGLVVRESVTVAGRAERARVARAFVGAVLGPGHPCGDDAGDGLVRVEVTDRSGPGVPDTGTFSWPWTDTQPSGVGGINLSGQNS